MVHADKVSDKKPTASASRFGRKTASGATAKSSFYNPLDRTKKDEVGKAVTFKKSLFDDTKPKTKEELEEDRLTELRLGKCFLFPYFLYSFLFLLFII